MSALDEFRTLATQFIEGVEGLQHDEDALRDLRSAIDEFAETGLLRTFRITVLVAIEATVEVEATDEDNAWERLTENMSDYDIEVVHWAEPEHIVSEFPMDVTEVPSY